MGSLFTELRRRRVFRFAGVYAAVAWLVIQVAGELESALELPDWFDGVTVTLLFLGFPVALVLAWFFDITPDGIRRSRPDPGTANARPARLVDVAILVVLGVIAAFVVPRQFGTNDAGMETDLTLAKSGVRIATDAQGNSFVAVLPFESRSTVDSDAFFADGVHDGLLTQLSKISSLKVISRTSVLHYRDTNLRIPQIASELGVAVILEGAVQRAGDEVLINVQLVDGKSDTHLWAEDYRRELTTENLFVIQSEIAHAIATSVDSLLTGADEAMLQSLPTRDMRAYEAYVRGKLLTAWGTGLNGHLDGIAAFDEAVQIDPDFAAAHALKAGYLMSLYSVYGYGEDARVQAEAALARAAALAPDSVDVLIEQAYYEHRVRQDFERATALFEQVLDRAPNHGGAWTGLAEAARSAGRMDEAITAFEHAMRLDPLNPQNPGQLLETFAFTGRFDDAIRMYERLQELTPDSSQVPFSKALIEWMQGDCAGTLDALAGLDDPGLPHIHGWRAATARRCGDAEARRHALDVWPESDRSPPGQAELYNISVAWLTDDSADRSNPRAELVRIRERIEAQQTPYPMGWSFYAIYTPAMLPALLGDAHAVNAAVDEYEAQGSPDPWASRFREPENALFLADVGNYPRATAYVEKQVRTFGPQRCLVFANAGTPAGWLAYEPFAQVMQRWPGCAEFVNSRKATEG